MAKSSRLLPEGWKIEGLWTGIGTPKESFTETGNPTDVEIAAADRILVSYTSRKTGVKDHRTIPGATSRRQIGAIIRYTTRVVSPVGRRSRNR